MKPINRRIFLSGGAAAGVLAGLDLPSAALILEHEQAHVSENEFNGTVDFRFAPWDFQSTICLPDDPAKTVVGKDGGLRYDFPHANFAAINQFGTIVEFTLGGMGRDVWNGQTMEAPGVPIIHTRFERPAASVELITFASR